MRTVDRTTIVHRAFGMPTVTVWTNNYVAAMAIALADIPVVRRSAKPVGSPRSRLRPGG
jgi:hypothetical protein